MRPILIVKIVIIAMVVGITLPPAIVSFAHGGKTHQDMAFTPLDALKKGTDLFDRLIASGKLDSSWETTLKEVRVETVARGDMTEYRTAFTRSSGGPGTVYFFLDADGNYTGSNFTGQ